MRLLCQMASRCPLSSRCSPSFSSLQQVRGSVILTFIGTITHHLRNSRMTRDRLPFSQYEEGFMYQTSARLRLNIL